MFQMPSSHSFSNVQPCKYFGRHFFFSTPASNKPRNWQVTVAWLWLSLGDCHIW